MTMTPTGYNPGAKGCSYPGCNSQQTETLDGVHGRRCADHPPRFDRGHFDGLVRDRGNVWSYLRTVLRLGAT